MVVLVPTLCGSSCRQVSATDEDEGGRPSRVITVTPSTLAKALDERRMSIVVDATTGTVLEAKDTPPVRCELLIMGLHNCYVKLPVMV